MKVAFTKVEEGLYGEILDLATRIWNECYAIILSPEQIVYMLEMMYRPEKIDAEIRSGTVWEVIEVDGARIGFTAYGLAGQEVMLNKVYFSAEHRGLGLLPLTLDRVVAHAKALGVPTVRLNVNKSNSRAIRAYEKNGFRVLSEGVFDIGQGYVMDDYILVRDV